MKRRRTEHQHYPGAPTGTLCDTKLACERAFHVELPLTNRGTDVRVQKIEVKTLWIGQIAGAIVHRSIQLKHDATESPSTVTLKPSNSRTSCTEFGVAAPSRGRHAPTESMTDVKAKILDLRETILALRMPALVSNRPLYQPKL